MNILPKLNEGDLNLLVSYSISSDEQLTEAVVNAFQAANIDVYGQPTFLIDWMNPDVFESIQWTSGAPVYFSTRIWDHRVVITAEEVRIYASSNLI